MLRNLVLRIGPTGAIVLISLFAALCSILLAILGLLVFSENPSPHLVTLILSVVIPALIATTVSWYPIRLLKTTHETEQLLRNENTKYQALLKNGSDDIHILNSDGNIVEASDSFCFSRGYSRDEVIGMSISRLDSKFSEIEITPFVRQLFEKKRSPIRIRNLAPSQGWNHI